MFPTTTTQHTAKKTALADRIRQAEHRLTQIPVPHVRIDEPRLLMGTNIHTSGEVYLIQERLKENHVHIIGLLTWWRIIN